MICDFCSSPDVRWEHNCTPFMAIDGGRDDGRWAVCEPCHTLIVEGDVQGLALRSCNHDPDPKPDRLVRTYIVTHMNFWTHHLGFLPLSEEEITAEHRVVAVDPYKIDGGVLWTATCACGHKTLAHPNYRVMRERFKAHSGGALDSWSVLD